MPANVSKKPILRQRNTLEKMSTEILHSKGPIILPKLPLPDLHATLQQYLLVVKPLTNELKFEHTKTLVEEFEKRDGMGEKLQLKLIERHAKTENWASEWWLTDMYLNNRAALPVNSNPGMVLPSQKFENELSRLRYAAKLTAGIIDYKFIIDNRALPVDVARGQLSGQPMCMEQYYRLLNSYRIPGYQTDRLVSFQPSNDEPQHIVVACNSLFFVVNVTSGKNRLNEGDLTRQFQRIVEVANKQAPDNVDPAGILTSINREEWAGARERLIQSSINRSSLDMLERCIFVLCLDKTAGATSDSEMAHQMLHGTGPSFNSSNRWFDKTVQLIISEDGTCGLCYEHSASEGIAVIALIEHLLKFILIKQSLLNAQITADTLDMEIFRFKNYGKEFIKRQHMSPDAYLQVALQVTYYRLYKHLVSTYESASTRRFREGRVDNIRAATIQALDFAKSIDELDQSHKDARNMQLLQKAIKCQTDITLSAITGCGIDCHLLGLKMIAEEMGLETPEIFSDPSYALTNYFQLSTSQIPTNTDSFMCYGAVVPDGYGVSYNPHPDSIVFCISSFRTCPSTNSKRFASALGETLQTMKSICQEWNKRRSASVERIEEPSQYSLHRRVHIRSPSTEDLRDDMTDQSNSNKDKSMTIAKKAAEKRKKFHRHKSLCVLKPAQTGTRETKRNVQTAMPQNAKLNRCYSEVFTGARIGSLVPASSSQFDISNDLLQVLRQASVEFI